MTHPRNPFEFLERHNENFKLERGEGGRIIAHAPCPACAAPDFWTFAIAELAAKVGTPATCKECQRSFKVIVYADSTVEVVQTGGPNLPHDYYIQYKRQN